MMPLIIGDIHGCYDELQTLLDKAAISDDEPLIALGDLADKGHQPQAVLDFFMTHPNASSIRGNHEQKHILLSQGEIEAPSEQVITQQKLGDRYPEYLDYMQSLPLDIELDEAILVHGYYDPHTSLKNQREDVLLGFNSGEDYLKSKLETAWFLLYSGEKPLIVGHKDYTQMQLPFIIENQVYGLDTRCVYGGALTALKLPEWDLIRVEAKQNYVNG